PRRGRLLMQGELRVLVCGSRTLENRTPVVNVLDGLRVEVTIRWDNLVVIEGGAPGADTFAGEWAEEFSDKHERYPANWEVHGKAAGFIRNKRMLEEGKPDVVWAFVDKPLAE